MTTWLWQDNTYGHLTSAAMSGAGSVFVSSDSTEPFPTPGDGQQFSIVINPNLDALADNDNTERQVVTAVSGTEFALAGTLANAHSKGEQVVLVITAAALDSLSSLVDVATYSFSYDTAGLLDGVDTGIAIPAGALMLWVYLSIPTNWTASSPPAGLAVADSAGNAVDAAIAGTGAVLNVADATSDADGTISGWSGGYAYSGSVGAYATADMEMYLALQASGGGDPGATSGTGTLGFAYVASGYPT